MSVLFPRTQLDWREPPAIQRARYRAGLASYRRLMVAGAVAGVAFIAYVASIAVDVALRMTLTLALVLGFLLFLNWAHKVFPVHVWITDDAVFYGIQTKNATFWRYASLARCEVGVKQTEDGPVATLTLVPNHGRPLVLGIAPSVRLDALRAALESRGVAVVLQSPLGLSMP